MSVDAARCSGCGLCARFCPTGALHFAATDAHFGLSLQTSACIACKICVVACPEEAVQLHTSVALSALLTDNAPVLMAGRLVTCTVCGILTADRADDQTPRCHVCRQGAGAVTALRDEAVLMADLLKRAPTPLSSFAPPRAGTANDKRA